MPRRPHYLLLKRESEPAAPYLTAADLEGRTWATRINEITINPLGDAQGQPTPKVLLTLVGLPRPLVLTRHHVRQLQATLGTTRVRLWLGQAVTIAPLRLKNGREVIVMSK